MKLAICVLAILSPALAQAEIAGDWVGVLTISRGDLHTVMHITGPDTELKATSDSPDQGLYNVRVPSISFSDSTLRYSIPVYDIEYSGVLNGNGSIVGSLTQHGSSRTLVLERSNDAARVMPPASHLETVVEKGRFHHDATRVEFDLPQGWSFIGTQFNRGNNGAVALFKDASGKAFAINIWMMHSNGFQADVSGALDRALKHEALTRAGEVDGGNQRLIPHYTIREDSVQRTAIAGNQAVLAIGEFQQEGKTYNELLAWIFTEHTMTHFVVRTRPENLAAVEQTFEQMLQSAKIP